MIGFTAGSKVPWFQRLGKYWGSLNIHCIASSKNVILFKAKKKNEAFSFGKLGIEWNNHSEPLCIKIKSYFFLHCKTPVKAQEFLVWVISKGNLDESWATRADGHAHLCHAD